MSPDQCSPSATPGPPQYHNYSDSTYSSGKAHLLSTGFPGTEEAQAKWLFVRALSTQHAWASWSPASMARPPHKGANILAAVYTLVRRRRGLGEGGEGPAGCLGVWGEGCKRLAMA